MTREQIDLVESTWAQVAPIKEEAAALFYGKLFELDPSVRPLFRGDLREQGPGSWPLWAWRWPGSGASRASCRPCANGAGGTPATG